MIDRLLKNLYERVLDNEVPARYFEEMIKDGEINPNEYFISVPLLFEVKLDSLFDKII